MIIHTIHESGGRTVPVFEVSELRTILNALECARDEYMRIAASVKDMPGHSSLALQFESQAKDANNLAALIQVEIGGRL